MIVIRLFKMLKKIREMAALHLARGQKCFWTCLSHRVNEIGWDRNSDTLHEQAIQKHVGFVALQCVDREILRSCGKYNIRGDISPYTIFATDHQCSPDLHTVAGQTLYLFGSSTHGGSTFFGPIQFRSLCGSNESKNTSIL